MTTVQTSCQCVLYNHKISRKFWDLSGFIFISWTWQHYPINYCLLIEQVMTEIIPWTVSLLVSTIQFTELENCWVSKRGCNWGRISLWMNVGQGKLNETGRHYQWKPTPTQKGMGILSKMPESKWLLGYQHSELAGLIFPIQGSIMWRVWGCRTAQSLFFICTKMFYFRGARISYLLLCNKPPRLLFHYFWMC